MKMTSYDKAKPVEMFPGVVRRTMAYNKDVILCQFELAAGAKIPLHNHPPSQIGYVISGRVNLLAPDGSVLQECVAGDSYVIDPNVMHGAEAIEATVFVECFNPSRPEYEDLG